MAQVNVTIAGKSYRMACGEGEEAHLTALAEGFDARISEMRKAFGEIGDMRLHVMAALMLSDEFAELKTRLSNAEAEVAQLRETVGAGEAKLADRIGRTAARLEQLTRSLSKVGPERARNAHGHEPDERG